MFIIYQLYLDEPSRTRASYVDWLFYFTGNIVSEMTISRFFNECFDHKGGFCRPNLVPFDKFKPENYLKMHEYLEIVQMFDPSRSSLEMRNISKDKSCTTEKCVVTQ